MQGYSEIKGQKVLKVVKMKKLFLTLLPIFIGFSFVSTHFEQEMFQRYFDHLKTTNYDVRVPPEGKPVRVRCTMYILNVHEVDDLDMTYEIQFYFRQSWKDSRLLFPDTVDADKILLNDETYVWTPDLFFKQEIEATKHKVITPNNFIRITSDGGVFYSLRMTMTLSCNMDFKNYPHDIQVCKFSIESFAKTVEELLIDWAPVRNAAEINRKINVLPFDVEFVGYGTANETDATGNYQSLEVHLAFHRKIGFYVKKLYVPFIILVILSWSSFWIKSRIAVLRVPLLLVILYMMLNIGSEFSCFVPRAPYTKAIDVWIAVCESLVFAAFLEFIIVSIVSRTEEKFEKKGSSSSSDPEALMISESEKKDKLTNHDNMNSASKIVASRLFKNKKLSTQIDTASRIVFPLLFVLFNFVYWIVY